MKTKWNYFQDKRDRELKHMPTPWKYEWDQIKKSWRLLYKNENGLWRSMPYHIRAKIDAAFIVRAVNNFETLLKALKRAQSFLAENDRIIDEAIAKAEVSL